MKIYTIIFLLVAVACGKDDQVPGPAVEPLIDNAPTEIAFISRRISNGEWQLYLMNTDGSNQRIISDHYLKCSPVTASHNGQKIVYSTYENNKNHLYVVNKADGAITLLTTNEYCGSPAWSPDDSKLLFVRASDVQAGNYSICIIDSDGKNEKILATNMSAGSAQWFPDGNTIGFVGVANGICSIYSIRVDGSGKKRLSPANQNFGAFRLSPSGEQMVLVSNNRGGSQLFLMSAGGGSTKQVTNTVNPDYWDIGFPREGNNSPDWSPDGKKIAYVSWANGSPDIFVMDANGKNDKRLTNTSMRDESPRWSRDGKYIFFNSNRDLSVSSEIYRMTPDGKDQTPLTKWRGDDIYPVIIKQ